MAFMSSGRCASGAGAGSRLARSGFGLIAPPPRHAGLAARRPLPTLVRRDLNSSESPSQGGVVSRGRVSCQADKRRVQRLEKQFAREMANLLCFDETILNALTPYRQYTYDEEDVVLAEVTEVSVSSDLQVAKVYVYFSGDDPEARMQAFNNLNRKAGYIRKELAQKVRTNEEGFPACALVSFGRTGTVG